jgi:hypothetical protein
MEDKRFEKIYEEFPFIWKRFLEVIRSDIKDLILV